MPSTSSFVLDADESTFAALVLEESRKRPVVVDFWAPWCGPCRTLGPILERLADQAEGRWILAKVNTDDNPEIAQEYKIRGIPAVKAFVDGQVISEFVGVQPAPQIQAWLKNFVPSPAHDLVRTAQTFADQGLPSDALQSLRSALDAEPSFAPALLLRAKLLLEQGDLQDAQDSLDSIPFPDRDEHQAAISALSLRLQSRRLGGLNEAEARLALHPDDLDLQIQLAQAFAAEDRLQDALDRLIAVIRKRDKKATDDARQAMLAIFDSLGPRHPLTETYRSLLAQELYR